MATTGHETARTRTSPRRAWWRRGAIALGLIAVTVGIVLAPGFDEREVAADDPAVWAMQSVTGQRFGRVNTLVGEVDTVKTVTAPTDIVQSQNVLLVYSNNLGSVTPLDTARPTNIEAAGTEATAPTPPGTDLVVSAGDYVAYLTADGGVLTGRVSDRSAVTPSHLDPFATVEVPEGEDRPTFRAVAVTVSPDGTVAAYSAERRAVVRANIDTGVIDGFDEVPDGPDGPFLQMTWVGESWALLEPDAGSLWLRGAPARLAVDTDQTAMLQHPTVAGDALLVADDYGVLEVALDGGGSERIFGSPGSPLGRAAAPMALPGDGALVAAWLPAGAGPGTLWQHEGPVTELSYGNLTLGEQRSPQLRSNGSRLILNEGRSGWVWSVPSGRLVPSSQQWDPNAETQDDEQDQEVATEVTDPRPPVAVDDAFGVRAGRLVSLPVLLNDHDPNKDVLTIEPALLTQPRPDFGTVAFGDDEQSLVVDVLPGATGTATFTYGITDGAPSDQGPPVTASVTLTVVDPSVNNPPEWCGVPDCQVEWPQPQVNPGGTVSVDVLSGWVDPEGDAIFIANAATSSSTGVVASSPEGRVVFQHTDINAGAVGTTAVDVTVSDAFGATARKALTVTILGEPQLRAADVAVTVVAGVTTTVELDDHVTGARGPLEVTEASLAPGDEATVAVAAGLTGFTFSAAQPGSHVVYYRVSDGETEARAKVRVTVLEPEAERLSTVPLTAFVRNKEDTTIDVLTAVSNPAGRVLLVNDATPEPNGDALLAVDVVGHRALRLSGDTSDSQPGMLGVVRYTVSDGTGRPEGIATGEVTVVLLGNEVPTPPVAVDDAITVRVGTQADISVLRNDTGPAGHVIALDAGSIAYAENAGLAFASSSRIRYLAPRTPGVYLLTYATYVLGSPLQADTATVTVTVLANDTNSPPTPRDLVGRAASGQSVRLPFVGTGIDPDGDTVALSRIVTQPASGSASVSADGNAIVYTADPGASGQVEFTFEVVDSRGLTATGTAHVGIIAAELETQPVVYTDYVQIQVGEGRRAVVTPAANDLDLTGGELELVGVQPDAQFGTAEYDDLEDRLTSVVDGVVTLEVGVEPGTFTYLYTVRTSAGSTGIGRIVLKAVREPVADVPIIADTVLALDTRASLETGVDVLTNKVSWGAGDVGGLELTLWGNPDGLRTEGWRIIGDLLDTSMLIPFQVTGTNFAGEEVVSYGFLRVPGVDEYRLSLKDTFAPPRVPEGESGTFDLKDLVAVPADMSLEVDASAVTASGGRPGSTCSVVAGTTIEYVAAMGKPYTDTCRISARLGGQDIYTVLPVPVVILAAAPQPSLVGQSLEISPGSTATYDLANMVTWPAGADPRPVSVSFEYTGQRFAIERDGTLLTITAADSAVPGSLEAATVSLGADFEAAAVSLTLRVGPAPSQLPKGATVARQCAQSQGSSCEAAVVGASGEVNPLPGTPLEVVSVANDPNCPAVFFSVRGTTSIVASWGPDTPGAVCTATFAVRDALGRISSGARAGSLALDLRGYPSAPSQVRQVTFGDGQLSLAVTPNTPGSSYPTVSGYAIYEGATKVASCGLDGACDLITGLRNGVKHTYTARAVNAVGESRGNATTVAWSYAPPAAPTNVTWRPSTNTAGEGKRIDIELDITDESTRELRITSPNGETRLVSIAARGHRSIAGVVVGGNSPQQVTITPITNLDLPPVEGAQAQGTAVTISAHGIGRPTLLTPVATVDSTGATASIKVPVTAGGTGAETWVGFQRGTVCEDLVQATGGAATLSAPVTANVAQVLTLCGESRVGPDRFGRASVIEFTVYPFVDPGPADILRGYRVSRTCVGDENSCATSVAAPILNPTGLQLLATPYYSFGGGTATTSFEPPLGGPFTADVTYCVVWSSSARQCSEFSEPVLPDAGWPEYATQVTVEGCRVGEAPSAQISAQADDYSLTWTLLDADDQVTTDYTLMRQARATVTFHGALNSIDAWSSGYQTCTGVPPDPEPTVTPTPEPSP